MQAVSGFYGLVFAKDDEKKAESKKKLHDGLEKVVAYLAKDNKPYICGKEPGFVDYMVWPHMERFSVLNFDEVKNEPVLKAYCERMENDPAVKACRHTNDLHMQFLLSAQAGNTTYDIGNVTEY